jgi:hypothetical protein
VGGSWLGQLQQAGGEQRERYLGPTRSALLEDMAPLHFPAAVPLQNGRLFTAVENLHPFWALYAPARGEDLRGLVGEVCAALRLPEPAARGSRLSGKSLATRVQRYLVQHPYISTLTLNVFNPGSGQLVADLLVELQRTPALKALNFDVRLFAADPAAPGLGETLRRFLSPAAGSREADAFAAPSGNHLTPKLALAVRDVADFRERPADYPAHLSLLFDVFPPEEMSAGPPLGTALAGSVYGLFQDFRTEYQDDEAGVVWRRQPCHGPAQPLPEAAEITALLADLPRLLSAAASVAATGKSVPDADPVISLSLGPGERAFLHLVHEVSDWVFTLDRNLGIEFFDHGGRPDRPDYLIDHSPEMVSPLGQRLVITSRSLAELGAIFRPVLHEYGLPADDGHAFALLHHLRSLSGRLALKARVRADAAGRGAGAGPGPDLPGAPGGLPRPAGGAPGRPPRTVPPLGAGPRPSGRRGEFQADRPGPFRPRRRGAGHHLQPGRGQVPPPRRRCPGPPPAARPHHRAGLAERAGPAGTLRPSAVLPRPP